MPEEERLKAVFDAMGDGLVLIDMDGKITAINPAMEKMSGYTKGEVVGKDAADVISKVIKPEDVGKIMGDLRTTLEGISPPPGTCILIMKDGREIPVAFTASFIKDAEGKPTAIVATIKDITELKRAEELKAAANKQRIEELEKFVKAAVGRELKMVELKKRIKDLESKLKEITGDR